MPEVKPSWVPEDPPQDDHRRPWAYWAAMQAAALDERGFDWRWFEEMKIGKKEATWQDLKS